MRSVDLIPLDFNYEQYVRKFKIRELFSSTKLNLDPSRKINKTITESVDPENFMALPPELDDLSRLHYIVLNRKVTTIMEFGVGKSTRIFAEALKINHKKYHDITSRTLRRKNLYQCHSVDNNQKWIDNCVKEIPNEFFLNNLVNINFSNVITSEFVGKVCTYYESLPNVCPDLIYLDGPDQFSPIGDVRGLSTRHQDRMPMAADILTFEHFLLPGTLIIVDGRTANARFLKSNFQRTWSYYYSESWDQHFFELQEQPLGKFNKEMICHCLGEEYFKRISDKK